MMSCWGINHKKKCLFLKRKETDVCVEELVVCEIDLFSDTVPHSAKMWMFL